MLKIKNLILIIPLLVSALTQNQAELTIHFIDVGQGDATLIATQQGQHILVDAGPDNSLLFELGQLLAPAVRTIDLVIITHPDLDHIGGLIELSKRYQIGAVIYNQDLDHNSIVEHLVDVLQHNQVKISPAYAGDHLQIGCCLELEFFWPDDAEQVAGLDVNDSSAAILFSHRDFELLITGDLGVKYELELVERINNDIEILQVGHHGSKTSTSPKLLEKVTPDIAVVSSGVANKFGHPHQEVLDLLVAHDITVMRTDQMGTISYSINQLGQLQLISH
jgi:competence protein ComEC